MKQKNIGVIFKRIISMLLSVVVLFTTTPGIETWAEESVSESVEVYGNSGEEQPEEKTTPVIMANNSDTYAGNYLTIGVYAEYFENIAGLSFAIHYDESILSVESAETGSFTSGTISDISYSTAGVVNVSMLSVDGITGSGELAFLTFYVSDTAQAGDYKLNLTVSEAYNTGMEDVVISKQSGTIKVMPSVEGTETIFFYSITDKYEYYTEETLTYQVCSEYVGGLAGGDFIVEYDSEYLKVSNVELGESLKTQDAVYAINSNTPGYIKISYANIDAVNAGYGTEFFKVTFEVKTKSVVGTSIRFRTEGLTDVSLKKLQAYEHSNEVRILEKELENEYPDFLLEWNGVVADDRTIVVDVAIPENCPVAAGDFRITYSNNQLLCQSVETDSNLSSAGGILVTKEEIDNGVIAFSYVNTNPSNEKTTLLHMKFDVVGDFIGYAELLSYGTGVVDVQYNPLTLDYPMTILPITYIDISQREVTGLEEKYAYTGGSITPQVAIEGLVAGIDYEVVYSNNVDIGEATVTIVGKGFFTGTIVKTFRITAMVPQEVVLEYVTIEYDGNEKKPQVAIEGLVHGTDYEISYSNNVNAGEATVTITGKGNYTGTVIKTFTITAVQLLEAQLEYLSIGYDGTEKEPQVVIEGLAEGIDYEVFYSNNVNVGEATVTITGKGNYTGKITKNFFIAMAQLFQATLEYESVVYDGNEKKPQVTIEGLMFGTDYEVVYANNVNVGEATVTITGKGNYTGTVIKTFTIVAIQFSGMELPENLLEYTTIQYDGTEKEPEVAIDGLVEGIDYEVEYSDNVNEGEATVTITGKGNYSGTIIKTFIITAIQLSEMELSENLLEYDRVEYDGSEKKPQVTIEGLVLGTDYDVSYSNNITIGEAMVTITGKGNYTGTITKTFMITAIEISGIQLPENVLEYESIAYDGIAKEPQVTIEGLVLGTDYQVSYSNNTDAGEATVIITGIGNYTGTIKLPFVIMGSENIWVKEIPTCIYTGSAQKPVLEVYDGATRLVEKTDYTVKYSNNTKVGTAKVVITGKGNYEKTIDKYFTIVPRDIADEGITVTCADKVHNGKIQVSNPVIKYGKITLKKGTDYTVTFSENQTDIGTVDVIIEGKGNYTGTRTTTYRIIENNISKAIFVKVLAQAYTGEEIRPEITVYANKQAQKVGEPLILGQDYEVSYENNIAVGTAKVIVEGLNDYGGSKTLTFSITKRNISSEDIIVEIGDGSTITYDGAAKKSTVKVIDRGVELEEGVDYTLTYANNKNAVTDKTAASKYPTVTIKGKGRYQGTRKEKFVIEPISIGEDGIAKEYVKVIVADASYTKKAVKSAVTIIVNGTTLKNGTDYTLTYANNIEMAEKGTENAPTVTITGKGNYAGVITEEFRIYEKTRKTFAIEKIPNQMFTGDAAIAIEPPIVVYELQGKKKVGDPLTEGIDYEVSYQNNYKVGTAKVTVTGLGEYAGTKTATFKIDKRAMSIEDVQVILTNEIVTYNGKAQKLEVVVMDNGRELVHGTDYTLKYTNNTNASVNSTKKPTITVTGKGTYAGSVKHYFTIEPKQLTASDITITVKDVLFNQKKAVSVAGITSTVTLKDGTKSLKNKTHYTISYTNNKEVGETDGALAPTVTITGKGNYAGVIEKTFRIYKTDISKAIVGKLANEVYSGSPIQSLPEVSFKESKTSTITLVKGEHYTVSWENNVKKGTAKVIITGVGEYGGTKTVTFKIVAKKMTILELLFN